MTCAGAIAYARWRERDATLPFLLGIFRRSVGVFCFTLDSFFNEEPELTAALPNAAVQQAACLRLEPTAIFHGPGARTSLRAAAPARPSRGSGMTREWAGGRSPSEIQGPRSKARARWYSYNQGPTPRPRAVIQNSGGRTLHAWRRRLTAVSVLPASLQATTHSSTRSNGLATCTKVFCLLGRGSLNNPPCGTRVCRPVAWRRWRLAGSDRIPSDPVGLSTKNGGSHLRVPSRY